MFEYGGQDFIHPSPLRIHPIQIYPCNQSMPAPRLIINLSIMRNPYSQSNVKLSSIHPFPWTTPVYHTIFLARHSVPILWHNNTLLNWCQSCHIIPQSDRFYHFTIVSNLSLPLFLLSSKPQHPLCLSMPVHPLSPIINLKALSKHNSIQHPNNLMPAVSCISPSGS